MKQLVSAIILALIAANIILIVQYKQDITAYETKIHNQSEIIKSNERKKRSLIDFLRSKSVENHTLHKQLDQIKQENGKLKKRLNNLFHFNVTAYSPYFESTGKTVGDPDYKVTASGEKVREGISIACPPSLAFGTKVNIQNVGLRVCDDRGGKIKTNHIDVYFDSVKDALTFGRQQLLVEVLGK
jgi:3D (Asp-Asp-Asp) domain-containing protein